MSSIWTRCTGAAHIRALAVSAWRVVEAQHQVATRKLVATAAEQEVLEELIDSVKPPHAVAGMHYLLFTPFRYPPLRHGSRFGTRQERGLWYGSEWLPTAFAEVAYYRLLFLEGTAADLGEVATELTAFRVQLRTPRGIDLTAPPFSSHAAELASRVSYAATQPFGRAARADGVAALRYVSARVSPEDGDVASAVNVAAFEPSVFGRRQPQALQTWRCTAAQARVEFTRRDYFSRESHEFARAQFLVDGALPAPGI